MRLLLLSHFSHVRLCATPQMAAHKAPPSLGFYRREQGCHFLLQYMKVKSESEVAQSCLTLRQPMDCSLPGSSVHGIFQGRGLWGRPIQKQRTSLPTGMLPDHVTSPTQQGGGTVHDAPAYCIPPLPGKVTEPLFLSLPSLGLCVSIWHWCTDFATSPARAGRFFTIEPQLALNNPYAKQAYLWIPLHCSFVFKVKATYLKLRISLS